ncbi:MAG: helix-turn-helix transcriptional regulator [Proteobacteria bacterium]|nr:helix-turn-helix transcriptional regulator [Pseudomonadota bacterium]
MKSVNSDEYQNFLDCLISARKEADVTQQELANRLGKPQSFVSKYENRERRLDVVEFLQIARTLEVNPSDLLKKMEIKTPSVKIREMS